MAADCLVSLDAFLSRLLSGPDSRAICSCVSMLARGRELSTASARAHPSWHMDGSICDGGALCQCCLRLSLGSPCVRVRAGVFAGIPVIWELEGAEATQLRLP